MPRDFELSEVWKCFSEYPIAVEDRVRLIEMSNYYHPIID